MGVAKRMIASPCFEHQLASRRGVISKLTQFLFTEFVFLLYFLAYFSITVDLRYFMLIQGKEMVRVSGKESKNHKKKTNKKTANSTNHFFGYFEMHEGNFWRFNSFLPHLEIASRIFLFSLDGKTDMSTTCWNIADMTGKTWGMYICVTSDLPSQSVDR